MDPEILKKFEDLEKKVDATLKSSEKTRKIFLWTLIISVAMIVLPLIGIGLIMPYFLKTIQLPPGL